VTGWGVPRAVVTASDACALPGKGTSARAELALTVRLLSTHPGKEDEILSSLREGGFRQLCVCPLEYLSPELGFPEMRVTYCLWSIRLTPGCKELRLLITL